MPENAAKEIQFCERWLKDGIGEDYRDWHCYGESYHRRATDVFIESATGTGKTTFILDTLCPFAAENGRNVLYLSNRTALERQTRLAIQRRWRQKENKGISHRDEQVFFLPNSFSKVALASYQGVLSGKLLLHEYYYIVFDEAHFFMEDALFNPRTKQILEGILKSAPCSVLIFLSATLSGCEKMLLQKTEKVLPETGVDPNLLGLVMRPDRRIYRNTYREMSYEPLFYREEDDLILRINQTTPEEKWLIFSSSIQRGKNLCRRIRKESGRKVSFLTAEDKSGKRWERLINEERFEQDILITTRVLDNGVNISDDSVRHVVIPFSDQVLFLQMLGRRRAKGCDRINLYAEVPTIQKINKLTANVSEKITAIKRVEKAHDKVKVLQSMWNEGRQEINSLFYISNESKLMANPFAKAKLKQLKFFYKDLAAHYKEGDYYEKLVLQWIGMGDSKPRYLGQTTENGLPDFLVCHAGVRMLQSEWEPFYQEFERLYEQECRERFSPESEMLQKAVSIRKAPSRRKSTINQQLRLLGLPYELKKEINCWLLCKK